MATSKFVEACFRSLDLPLAPEAWIEELAPKVCFHPVKLALHDDSQELPLFSFYLKLRTFVLTFSLSS